MIAIANLNYFQPHKNPVLFWLTQFSFMATALKYLAAMMLRLEANQTKEGNSSRDIIGYLLVGIDIAVLCSFLLCVCLAIWHTGLQLKKILKVKRRIKALASAISSHKHLASMASSRTDEGSSSDASKSGLREWRVRESADTTTLTKSTKIMPSDDGVSL